MTNLLKRYPELEPGRGKILAKPYERPETTPGGIIVNPAWRTDTSGSLWDFLAAHPEAEDKLGMSFREDLNYILVTPMYGGIDLGDGETFVLAWQNVEKVVPWKGDEDEK